MSFAIGGVDPKVGVVSIKNMLPQFNLEETTRRSFVSDSISQLFASKCLNDQRKFPFKERKIFSSK